METRMQRAELTAPTTPEQYRAALDRQERVIQDQWRKVKANEEELRKSLLKRVELAARCDRLNGTLKNAMALLAADDLLPAPFRDYANSLISEAPDSSLAHVRSEAIDYAVDQCEHVQYGQCPHAIEVETLIKFAASIRKGDHQ